MTRSRLAVSNSHIRRCLKTGFSETRNGMTSFTEVGPYNGNSISHSSGRPDDGASDPATAREAASCFASIHPRRITTAATWSITCLRSRRSRRRHPHRAALRRRGHPPRRKTAHPARSRHRKPSLRRHPGKVSHRNHHRARRPARSLRLPNWNSPPHKANSAAAIEVVRGRSSLRLGFSLL